MCHDKYLNINIKVDESFMLKNLLHYEFLWLWSMAQMEVDLLKIPQLALCLISVHSNFIGRIHVHLHEN